MAFKRWQDIPEVQDAANKLISLAQNYNALISTGKTEDRPQALKVWQSMSSSYWDILFALVDAHTQKNIPALMFDTEERLFIDLGFIAGVSPLSKNFDVNAYFSAKCSGGILPAMTFSDYISESWASITGNPAPEPVIGMSLNARIASLTEELDKNQKARNLLMSQILGKYSPNINAKATAQTLTDCLISAMKVNMRVPEYRAGDEPTRQKLTKERKAYIDAVEAVNIAINSALKNEASPLPPATAEKFTELHARTEIIMREILYSQIDTVKIARRSKKITESCAEMSHQMRRAELRNMLAKKRDYLTVPAKTARADTSLICQPESMPIDYAKSYAILEDFCRMDIAMFSVPRVRMYGLPRAIFVPGQGLGTYDWSDHTLLIPAFPIGSEDRSAAYALGTFRWDSDEDRRLKTPYENIKENRKKSLLVMAASFYKDYALWLTKEKKGYRILPKETHKAFIDMFAPRKED